MSFQNTFNNMTSQISSEPKLKRQRIMIISGDDSVIDQIQKINNISSCKSIILDTSDEDIQISHSTVKKNIEFVFLIKFIIL